MPGPGVFRYTPDPAAVKLLDSTSFSEVVRNSILERVPWIFRSNPVAFKDWREAVASEAGVDSAGVYLVGSAATGFSMAPEKYGRPFQLGSDLDVAIVDQGLFEGAWDRLVELHRIGRARLGDQVGFVQRGIYWGHISQDAVPSNSDSSRRVRAALNITTKQDLLRGRSAKMRLYRRRADLEGYHENGLRLAKAGRGGP